VALQRDLARLEQWAESWGMVFNASKCHIMHVSRSSSSHQYLYQFHGVVLSSVTSEKYLGVYLNHDLKWSHHIDQVTAKAARKLGFVRRNFRGSPVDCNKKAKMTLTNPPDAKGCKIAPIRRVSFRFTEFHFPKFQITNA